MVGNLWVMRLRGEHDVSTEAELRKEFRALTQWGRRVVVDLTDAAFVGSTTLGAIWAAYCAAGRPSPSLGDHPRP